MAQPIGVVAVRLHADAGHGAQKRAGLDDGRAADGADMEFKTATQRVMAAKRQKAEPGEIRHLDRGQGVLSVQRGRQAGETICRHGHFLERTEKVRSRRDP